MRTLLTVEMNDTHKASLATLNGEMEKIFKMVQMELKPEFTFYYAGENGARSANFIFDLKYTSMIPSIAEPFFHVLNASVKFFPVMNQDELGIGLESWNKRSGEFTGSNASLS